MNNFLLYGVSLLAGITILYFFIKFVFSSLRNEIKQEKKEELLNKKLDKVSNEINSFHKDQSKMNTQAYHDRLMGGK